MVVAGYLGKREAEDEDVAAASAAAAAVAVEGAAEGVAGGVAEDIVAVVEAAADAGGVTEDAAEAEEAEAGENEVPIRPGVPVGERLAHVPSSLVFEDRHQALVLLWCLDRDTDRAHVQET